MLLVPVVSTDVAAMGYDPVSGELQVQFTTGRIYSYANVEPETYDAFVNAPSKGSFLAQVFRKNPAIYPSIRIL